MPNKNQDDFYSAHLQIKSDLTMILSNVEDSPKGMQALDAAKKTISTLIDKLEKPSAVTMESVLSSIANAAKVARRNKTLMSVNPAEAFSDELGQLHTKIMGKLVSIVDNQSVVYESVKTERDNLSVKLNRFEAKNDELTAKVSDTQDKYCAAADGLFKNVFSTMKAVKDKLQITDGSENNSSKEASSNSGKQEETPLEHNIKSFNNCMSEKRCKLIKVLSAFIPENAANPSSKSNGMPTNDPELQDAARILCKALLNDTVLQGGMKTEAMILEYGNILQPCLQSVLGNDNLSDDVPNHPSNTQSNIALRAARVLQHAGDGEHFLVFPDGKQYDDFIRIYEEQKTQNMAQTALQK